MSIELYTKLSQRENTLITKLVSRLRMSAAPHYQDMDIGLLEQRAARVVEAFILSLAENPDAFVEYIRDIAEERISEGYLLGEIQFALNILEESAWQIVVGDIHPNDHVFHLGRISGTISAAKDALARIYLNHMVIARAEVDRLEARIGALCDGSSEQLRGEDDEFSDLDA
jgi:hypothetical protein